MIQFANPWDNEPDEKAWKDEETGFACQIIRNHFGVLCGYVGVSQTHPLHGKGFQDLEIDVHDGLSFAGNHKDLPPPLWFFGFHCCHAHDIAPRMLKFDRDFYKGMFATYKDMEFVEKECRDLAGKLKGWG